MQTVMLLARERGLHSCAQEAWSVWHPTIESFLQLPPELMVFSGMALGYRDDSAAINSLRTERAALEAIASLKGF
jgi:nitroreductase